MPESAWHRCLKEEEALLALGETECYIESGRLDACGDDTVSEVELSGRFDRWAEAFAKLCFDDRPRKRLVVPHEDVKLVAALSDLCGCGVDVVDAESLPCEVPDLRPYGRGR